MLYAEGKEGKIQHITLVLKPNRIKYKLYTPKFLIYIYDCSYCYCTFINGDPSKLEYTIGGNIMKNYTNQKVMHRN